MLFEWPSNIIMDSDRRIYMKYPNGIRPNQNKHMRKQAVYTYANRGMSLEEDINITNDLYNTSHRAVVHKKPTPIQIVRVNYPKRSAAVITEAYFQSKSTTDYNGIYRGKHLDFEAKETKNKTLFPLANFHPHQIEHMEQIIAQDGLCFCIIRFTVYDETYFIKADDIIHFYKQMEQGGRKSISYDKIQTLGILIPFHYQTRVDYLRVVDQLFF